MVWHKFKQVPQVAVKISKNRDRAIIRTFRFTRKLDTFRNHLVIVAPEIIGAKKQKYSTTRLIADKGFLLGSRGSSQQEVGSA